MKGAVTFYFGPGSRYSYLASTQLPRISGGPIRSTPQIGGGSTARSIALKTSRDGLLSMASYIPSLTGVA
jgi:hypothetical protein